MVWISIWISGCRSACADICTTLVPSSNDSRKDVHEDMGLTLKPYNKPLKGASATKIVAFTGLANARRLAER